MSPFGPVLLLDLRRLARKDRYFWLRTIYGIVLLLLMLVAYQNHPINTAPAGNQGRLASDLAERFLLICLSVQFVLVILLAPAAAGSAITEEKERRTLDDLLTTRLGNCDIVLSKLLSRLTHLTLFLLAGFPIVSLTLLLGGVSPGLLWGGLAATGLTLLSVSSLAVCLSVPSARSATATTRIYVILAGYFLLWGLTEWVEYGFWGLPVFDWDRPRLPVVGRSWLVWPAALLEVLNAGNFLEAYKNLRGHVVAQGGTYAEALPELLTRYAVFHGAIAVLCLYRAVTRLRSAAARGEAPAGGVRKFGGWRPRPGRYPVWWKELHVESGWRGNLATSLMRGLFVLGTLLPGIFLVASPAWSTGSRVSLYVRTIGTAVACVALLAVTSRAAASLGLERERRTLPLLLATPLTERAIWWAKWFGSILSARWLLLLVGGIWTIGIIGGGLHAAAAPLIVAVWLACAAFMASLGLFFGVYTRTTARAVLGAASTALLVTGGPWACFNLLAASSPYWDVLSLTFVICGIVVGPAFPFILYSEAKSRRRKTPVPQMLFLTGCCAAPWLLAILALVAKDGGAFIDALTPPVLLSAAAFPPGEAVAMNPIYVSAGMLWYLLAALAMGYGSLLMLPRWCGRIRCRRRPRRRAHSATNTAPATQLVRG